MALQHPQQMRALIFDASRGPVPTSLTLQTIPAPQPTSLNPNEVLIRIKAAGLIAAELTWADHPPSPASPALDHHVVCPDYSGVIVAVGSHVTNAAVGDEVMAVSVDFDPEMGMTRFQGGAAEYAVTRLEWVTRVPKGLEVKDAAGVMLCGLTAWQALGVQVEMEGRGKVGRGTEVLVVGAAGATGLWVVQVAKVLGARVTALASDKDGIAILNQLGVDEVVNYKIEDVEVKGRKFDVVVDCVGGKALDQACRVVKLAKDGGLVVSIVEYEAKKQAPEGIEAKFFIWRPLRDDMAQLVQLIEEGKLKPITDSYWSLDRGVEAYAHANHGHCHGKVIIEC